MNDRLGRVFAVLLLFFVTTPGRAIEFTPAVPATAETTIWGFDRSFGNDGFVYFQPPKYDDGKFWYPYYRTFLMPDGRILVNLEYLFDYGGKDDDSGLLALRFEPQGDLITTADFESSWTVGLQPDGKIIVADFFENRPVLKRYNDDFSLDPAFLFPNEAELGNIFLGAIQPDGKILYASGPQNDIVYRLNSDGSFDDSFPVDIGPFVQIEEIVSHTDGSFLIEERETISLHCSARVYMYSGTYIGSLYESYTVTPGNFCNTVDFAPYPDGGFVWSHAGEELYRSKPDTTLDENFGDAGRVEIDLGPGNEVVTIRLPLISQPDGKILIVGLMENPSGTWPFVARYNSDGSPDASFGNLGVFTIYLPFKNNWLDDFPEVLLQEDGKIIISSVSADHFVLIRLQEYPVNNWLYLPLVR